MFFGKPAGRGKLRAAEAVLVALSLAAGYLAVEIGYRAWIYYDQAIEARYSFTTIDHRIRRTGFGAPGGLYGETAPGSIQGVFPGHAVMTVAQYDVDNRLLQRQQVRTNNLGWVPEHDYRRTKPPGEVRIAIVGDSMTAGINNEHPWPDIVQRRLNADGALLQALGAERITVLNLGVAAGSLQLMANPLAVIARRFDADMIVVNFPIEDLWRRHSGDFLQVPAEPAVPPDAAADAVPAVIAEPGPHITAGPVEIGLECTAPPLAAGNPACTLSRLFYVPPALALDGAGFIAIKREAAGAVLRQRVLLSPQPLVLRRLVEGWLVRPAAAYVPALRMTSVDEADDIAVGLAALRFIARLADWQVLVTHNVLHWHLTGQSRPALLDRFTALAAAAGFAIVQMEDHLPLQRGEQEWGRWYNLPHDGHWSDHGAEVYGTAMAGVIRSRLLAARGLAAAAEETACAAAYASFRDGRAAARAGDAEAALAAFTDAVAALPPAAAERARRATRYGDCGFLADLQGERALLLEGRGDTAAAAADWQAAVALAADPADLYRRRAERHRARGDAAGAIADQSELLRLRRDDPALYLARGTALLAAGEAAAALADFTAGLALRPDDLTLRFQRGQARMMTGDYAGVIEDVDAALLLMPGNAGLFFMRAGAETALGRLEAALADDTAAIAALPGQAAFHQARADLLDRLGRNAEAAAERATAAGLR